MELNLHHHIEACFSSLTRLTTDNADRTQDKLVRQIEELQEIVEKGLKGLKSEVKDVRKEMIAVSKDFVEGRRTSVTLQDSISSLSEKLGHLDQKIVEIGNRHPCATSDTYESEHEASSSAYSHGKASPSRRSASARTSASSRPEVRQLCLGNATHASASTQNSFNSSRGKHSNTSNKSGSGVKNDEQNPRRDFFSDSGVSNGQVPDIRDHPAYRGVAEGYRQSSPIFQAPDYGQTWYQHAFGPRQ